jgi:nicotinate-nucleotide pyrophosphorylase (carboxylating)
MANSPPPEMPALPSWQPLVALALAEDIAPGDVTSALSVPADARGLARLEAREDSVVCGLAVAEEAFREVDPLLRFEAHTRDGEQASAGERLITLEGRLRSILAGERTALNFLSRMCGVAGTTRRYVDAVAGTRVEIVDTRKTLPGWRMLDKYAVAVGGGTNHRIGLFDGILLKDNHLAAVGGVEAAVKSALSRAPANLRVQVEVQSEAEAHSAVEAGADFLLLDNLSPDVIREIVEALGARALLEASGGITLENVRAYAETGVQRISIGALTHSAPHTDLALELDGPDAAR